ncbi:uridylate kinase [Streptomyces hygroscopicus subsp. limoneus]|nr:uridylate kinase [Streptomyces hygroscopicus subsp. limoneus]
MTAVAMQSIAEPFIRLRADRYLQRGRIVLLTGGAGQPYVTDDYAAVQRALELSADALLVAKRGVDGVYDSDPKTHPDAKRYAHLTYQQAIVRRVKVRDTTAFVLAEEQGLVMHVFDVAAAGAMPAICAGRGATSAPRSRLADIRRRAGRLHSERAPGAVAAWGDSPCPTHGQGG